MILVLDKGVWVYIFITTMNLIQRAWLVVLRPVSGFVNEKLAKKSGLLGRIGRFYAFGPREFGYHPSSKLLAWVNHTVVSNMGFLFHKYSMIKSITMNGHTFLRSYRVLMMLGMLSFMTAAFYFSVPEDHDIEEGTTLKYLKDRLPATPINALQSRTSAHYTEINDYYMHEMAKKLLLKQEQILEQRKTCSDEVKKTRYARSGYHYITPHSNYNEKNI